MTTSKWLLAKQEKQAQFEGKKKSSKPSKTKADDGINPPPKITTKRSVSNSLMLSSMVSPPKSCLAIAMHVF
jgi:hypothetical protein